MRRGIKTFSPDVGLNLMPSLSTVAKANHLSFTKAT